MNWREYIGKRLLIGRGYLTGDISEVEVLDVSPSGKYVKLKYLLSGFVDWQSTDRIMFIEELG